MRGRCRRCGEDHKMESFACRGFGGPHGSDCGQPHDYTPDTVCGTTARYLGKALVCEEDAEHGGRSMRHTHGAFSWGDGEEPRRHALHIGRGPGTSDAQDNMISAAEMLTAADRIEYAIERFGELLKGRNF